MVFTVSCHSNTVFFILNQCEAILPIFEGMEEMNIPIITFPSVLSVKPSKIQQSWAGSQLWNVLEICCKYWNHICLAVLPGFHYEVLVSLMPQGLWTQIQTSENFDMHICKIFAVKHCMALALPHTFEQLLWVPEFGGITEARSILKKKKGKKKMYVQYSQTSPDIFPVFFTSTQCQNILFFSFCSRFCG